MSFNVWGCVILNHTGYYPFDRIIRNPEIQNASYAPYELDTTINPPPRDYYPPSSSSSSSSSSSPSSVDRLQYPSQRIPPPPIRSVSLLRQRATRTSPMVIPHPHPRKNNQPYPEIIFNVQGAPHDHRGIPFRDLRPRSYFAPDSVLGRGGRVEIEGGNQPASERFSMMKRPAFRLRIPWPGYETFDSRTVFSAMITGPPTIKDVARVVADLYDRWFSMTKSSSRHPNDDEPEACWSLYGREGVKLDELILLRLYAVSDNCWQAEVALAGM